MAATLYATAMWVLLQLLFVWFCARLAAVRELDVKDYLELQTHLLRNVLDVSARESQQQSLPAVPSAHHPPPAGVARA
jgi:hypothetical protein